MEFSAAQIAEMLEGVVEGDEQAKVNTLSKIEEGQPGSLSFLANPQYTPYIYKTSASIVIVNDSFNAEAEVSATLIRVPDAYQAFAKLLEIYNQILHDKKGVEEPVYIHESVTLPKEIYLGAFTSINEGSTIGEGAKIYPNVYIGNQVHIGKNCLIYPGVKIMSHSVIGDNVTLHSGVIIGGDGFGFAPNSSESYNKVAQIGNVIIEDQVEIGANSTIDRATLGSTIIRKGVKLDNLIQIAHNVEVGENTVIAAQSGVAGSTKIGSNCMIGGQVGITGHVTVGNRVRIAAQSGIASNLPDDATIQGSPGFDHMEFLRSFAYFKNLPKVMADLRKKN
jgi:UDP-3-O-[3-hydroxymyristoyl] glucosamine N-acyltransferase